MSKAKYRIPLVEDANATPVKKKKPKMGRLIGAFFGITLLIMICFVYTMTADYVFNDVTNFTSLRNAKDFGEFWLNLFQTALSSPLSQQWLKATYAWDLQSFGGNAPGWSHAVNICLHIFTCLYFYAFVFRLAWRFHEDGRTKLDPYYVAAAATALLACHPLVTGSIGYISGRAGVLGGVNYFLALNCFLYGFLEEKLDLAFGGYVLFFLLMAIGISSNIQCYSLPFVAVVTALVLKPADETWKEWLLGRSWEIGMFGAVGVGALCLLTFPLPQQVNNGFGLATLSPPLYVASQLKLLVTYYLKCFFFPFGLAISPQNAVSQGWSDIGTISGIAVVLLVSVLGTLSKRPLLQIATAIFVFSLFPWLVKAQPELVADNRFYLPLAALSLAFALPVASCAALNFRRTAIGFGVLIALLTGLTIYRNVQWSTEKQLWRAEVRLNDKDSRAHAFRARFLLTTDKQNEAKTEVEKALQENPDDLLANAVRAQMQFNQNEFYGSSLTTQKTIDLGKALKLPENELAPYYVTLSRCYMEMGDIDKADKAAEFAFRYIKGDSFLYYVLGKYQLKQHQPLIALSTFEDGYKRDPSDPDFLEAIAEASLDTRMSQTVPNAYTAAKKAMRIRRSTESAKLFVRACLEMGRLQEVKPTMDQLKHSEARSPEVMYLWSAYHKMTGETDISKKEREFALAGDPDVENRFHLKLAVKPGGKLPEPDILPKGVATPHPDITKIDPKVLNILAPKKAN